MELKLTIITLVFLGVWGLVLSIQFPPLLPLLIASTVNLGIIFRKYR